MASSRDAVPFANRVKVSRLGCCRTVNLPLVPPVASNQPGVSAPGTLDKLKSPLCPFKLLLLLCLETEDGKGAHCQREKFSDLGRKVTARSQPSEKGSVTMRSIIILLQLLTGLFEAADTDGSGMWDPWRKPTPQSGGTWDPNG